MPASAAAARARYASTTVATVSPAQLLCMLYDRLVTDLEVGADGLEHGRPEARAALDHALDILTELRASLDVSAWSGGPGLARLYAYLITEVIGAQIGGDPERARACRRIVGPLRDAWHEAATPGGA